MFKNFISFDLLDWMAYTTSAINGFADKIGIPSVIFFWPLAALALLIGLGGFHLSKLLTSLSIGGLGYFVGTVLYGYLATSVKAIGDLPAFIVYIVGGVFALVFYALSIKKPMPTMFLFFACLTTYIAYTYISQNLLLAIGIAFLVAAVCAVLIKLSMVLFTSLLGGFALIAFLNQIFKTVTYFALGSELMALWVALGVSGAFFLIQLISTRRYTIR